MGKIGNARANNVLDADIISTYQKLQSGNKTAVELGIAAKTVYKVLAKSGIERVGYAQRADGSRKFTPAQSAEIRSEYEFGSSFADLIAKFGGTFYSIKSAIKRAGGKLTPVCPPVLEEERQTIISMFQAGASRLSIARSLNRTPKVVSKVLREIGEFFEAKTGNKHPNWNGGRFKNGSGYFEVHLSPTDPLFSMARRSGYVLEHRLVMARKLGRPLGANETVHHVNGDRSDNSADNLQLRQGFHGKHMTMCCHDCGSRNIGSIALEEIQNAQEATGR